MIHIACPPQRSSRSGRVKSRGEIHPCVEWIPGRVVRMIDNSPPGFGNRALEPPEADHGLFEGEESFLHLMG
jgi:hypothetical protein